MFLVEERSMQAFLEACLPKILGGCTFAVYPHEGKRDLLKNLQSRLNGHKKQMQKSFYPYIIVVIVDSDGGDCNELKSKMEQICTSTNLKSRRSTDDSDWQVVTRIAVEELEAWYFGDWPAVLKSYPKVSPTIPKQASYRNPDAIKGGTWEKFEKILQRAGYFRQGINKAEVAASIGKHIDPQVNKSHSFKVFRDALIEATTPR
ncbi:DUF4276 family protein [Candidatus Poriferisocius sp.]|uniref:DUF4276 family protein n=1 Tax=Candidatus Poriferisocius sp. TaxID=3101276 RepID=UPI003B01303B